jgi:hypothetical protein
MEEHEFSIHGEALSGQRGIGDSTSTDRLYGVYPELLIKSEDVKKNRFR